MKPSTTIRDITIGAVVGAVLGLLVGLILVWGTDVDNPFWTMSFGIAIGGALGPSAGFLRNADRR